MTAPLDPRLGRHQVHDIRSFGFALDTPADWPTVDVAHARRGPLTDQGNLGSCTAHAALGCLMTDPLYRRDRRPFTVADATSVYAQETRLDDQYGIPGVWPPTDTGSCFLASAKALQQRGWITSYWHAFGLKAAIGALARGPISVGLPWYDSMLDPPEDGLVRVGPRAQLAGGHQIAITALYPSRQLVGFPNSWGPRWGNRGWGFMTYSTLSRLLSEGGDVGTFII